MEKGGELERDVLMGELEFSETREGKGRRKRGVLEREQRGREETQERLMEGGIRMREGERGEMFELLSCELVESKARVELKR